MHVALPALGRPQATVQVQRIRIRLIALGI
jgi:hypothetical protein